MLGYILKYLKAEGIIPRLQTKANLKKLTYCAALKNQYL